ncbi:unnamed protein product, partial [marine sediment metagenome]
DGVGDETSHIINNNLVFKSRFIFEMRVKVEDGVEERFPNVSTLIREKLDRFRIDVFDYDEGDIKEICEIMCIHVKDILYHEKYD